MQTVSLCSIGPDLDGLQQHVEIRQQFVGGLGHLHRQAGVEHVRRGHPLVDEAGFRADVFGHRGKEGDDIVLDLGLDGVDPGDVEIPLCADDRHHLFRNDPQFRLGLAGQGLDLQPDAEPVFRLPDSCHFGAGIAWNHCRNLLEKSVLRLKTDGCQLKSTAIQTNTVHVRKLMMVH